MFSFGNKKVNRRREAKAAAELSRRPKLERRNAVKNIDYDLSWASSSSDESTPLQFTRSLDLSPVFDSSESSFRIGGSIDGEVEHLYLRLGLSGPEDFGIPVDAWEESLKARSSSDLFPRSRFLKSDSLPKKLENSNLAPFLPEESRAEAAVLSKEVGVRLHAAEVAAVLLEETRVRDDESKEILQLTADRNGCNDAGIIVTQLPVVTACPSPAPVLSPPSGRSVLEPTTSITLPVDDRSQTIHEIAFSEVLSEENGYTHPAKVSSLQEEFNVRDKELVDVSQLSSGRRRLRDVGIKGTRPPVLTPPPPASVLPPPPMRSVLAPPPSMTLPIQDRASSPWDIVRSFAPADENEEGDRRRSFDSAVDEEKEDEEEAAAEEEVAAEEEGNWVENRRAGEDLERAEMLVETTDGTGSFSTTNEDDSSSTTTEYVISPNGYFKKKIKSWMRGQLLGSGSFGTVYEGISDDGTFIAIKEVSLLDKGSNAKQCILQLEQEIALLSQFEHENIVQYYGTDKEESKLVIFLELVTQGSLASLYQKYHLRDTQVSAYTRQILNGLNYLHERNVVHRDIKCANILVHANGSVKLADFGLAKEISRFSDLKSCKGSVYWMAPEVVHPKKTYGRAADIWSLGCTVLELLTRQIPYPNVEWQHAFYKIGRGDQPPIPNHLSSEAQDFIRNCVQVDPNSRPTAAQLLKHPFVMRPAETLSY